MYTHASQCAKNELNLLVLSPVNQADKTENEMSVAITRIGVRVCSPSKRPAVGRSESHDDIFATNGDDR